MTSTHASDIALLRELSAKRDGRIQLLYETVVKALAELDRDYVKRDPPPPSDPVSARIPPIRIA